MLKLPIDMSRALMASLVLFFALPGGGSPVYAADFQEQTMVVIPVITSGDVRSIAIEYRDAVEEAVKRKERYGVLGLSQAQERSTKVAPVHYEDAMERFRAIEASLSQAEEVVFTDPGAALPAIDVVLSDLDTLVGLVSENAGFEDTLFKAYMLKARALMDSGERAKAQEQLLAVVRVFGTEAEVTRASFHPSIVAAYEDVLKSDEGQETGSLEVKSTFKGATIYLSGRKIDLKTDAVISGLVKGPVNIRTVSSLGRSLSHLAEIQGGGSVSIDIDHNFESALELSERSIVIKAEGNWDQTALQDIATRLASIIGVDKVLLTGVVPGSGSNELAGMLVSESGQLESAASLSIQEDVVSYKKAGELVDQLGIRALPRDESFSLEGPWYEDYVAWSLTGVGLVGTIVGAVKGIEYSDKSDELSNSTPETYSLADVRTLQSDAESAGTISAVSLGLGITSLVAGTTMFLLHDGEPESEASRASDYPVLTISPGMGDGGPVSGASVGLQFSF